MGEFQSGEQEDCVGDVAEFTEDNDPDSWWDGDVELQLLHEHHQVDLFCLHYATV